MHKQEENNFNHGVWIHSGITSLVFMPPLIRYILGISDALKPIYPVAVEKIAEILKIPKKDVNDAFDYLLKEEFIFTKPDDDGDQVVFVNDDRVIREKSYKGMSSGIYISNFEDSSWDMILDELNSLQKSWDDLVENKRYLT